MMHYAKKGFIVLFCSIFVSMIGISIILPLLPIYADSLGAKGLALAVIFAGFPVARAIFMPIVGRISDKRGRKMFIAWGLLIYGAISLAFPAAQDINSLTLFRIIQGLAAAMILPTAMAYIGDISPVQKEGLYMGIFNVALFAGFGTGPFMGGVLMDFLGMNYAFYAMGCLSIISCIFLIIFLPRVMKTNPAKVKKKASYRNILTSNILVAASTFRFISSFGRGILSCFMPLLASQLLFLKGWQIGLILSCNLLLISVFQAPFGKLADLFSRSKLVIIGYIVFAISLFLVPFSRNFHELLIVNLAMGLSGAISLPPATAMVVEEGRRFGMGSTMGLFNMAMSFGLAGGPLLSGLFVESLGLESPFYIAAVAALLGLLIFIFFINRSNYYSPAKVS
jgi:DHA1 family multidrug resistance protein-like MFS transporter